MKNKIVSVILQNIIFSLEGHLAIPQATRPFNCLSKTTIKVNFNDDPFSMCLQYIIQNRSFEYNHGHFLELHDEFIVKIYLLLIEDEAKKQKNNKISSV